MIGFLSDKIGRINIAGIGTLIAGLAAFFLWIFAGRYYAGAIVYSLFGCFAGCIWACVAPVGAEVVGLQLLPSGERSPLPLSHLQSLTMNTQPCPSHGSSWSYRRLSPRSLV